MGAVYNRQAFTATGQYLLVPAGAGLGAGGWQVSVYGTFVASGLLKSRTSPPGSAVTLGSALTYYDATSLASSSAAITAAKSVVIPLSSTGSDLYLDLTYTSGEVVVLVTAAGEEIGNTEGNLSAFNPTYAGALTGPAFAVTAAGAVSGVTTLAMGGALSGVTTLAASGIVSLTNTTQSTSTATGALVVSGGAGFAKDIYTAGQIVFAANAAQAAGSIAKNATYGLSIYGVAGSSYDFILLNGAGSEVLRNPTGTQNVSIAGTLSVTGTSTLTGNLGVGTPATTDIGLYLAPTALTSAAPYGVAIGPTFPATATTSGIALAAQVKTAAASFTMTTGYGVRINDASKGAGSAITTLYGLYIAAQTAGATNYAIYSAGGANYLAGDTMVGATAYLGWTGLTAFTSPGNGALRITNNTATAFSDLYLGPQAGATTSHRIQKKVSAIVDNTDTAVFTVTVPNAAHSATIRVTLAGSLGAGGAVGANEATHSIAYDIAIARTAGVATVATVSSAFGSANSAVAGAATITTAGSVGAMTGAVGDPQTFPIYVKITKGSGASDNHTCLAVAELVNANATGISFA